MTMLTSGFPRIIAKDDAEIRERTQRQSSTAELSVDAFAVAAIMAAMKPCPCCGGSSFESTLVLWPELVQEWGLSKEEADYINRQQGTLCRDCGNNLRSMALAEAILGAVDYRKTFRQFVRSPRAWRLNVLEINEAGPLSQSLARLRRRTYAAYPEVDMQRLPYPSGSFDLVVHSDTLEHVPDPVKGLAECCRVLKPGGFCCFTVPIVVGRLTRNRRGLPPSFHGRKADCRGDYLVQTEYGSDFWADVLRAGFSECRIFSTEFPAAQAVAARSSF